MRVCFSYFINQIILLYNYCFQVRHLRELLPNVELFEADLVVVWLSGSPHFHCFFSIDMFFFSAWQLWQSHGGYDLTTVANIGERSFTFMFIFSKRCWYCIPHCVSIQDSSCGSTTRSRWARTEWFAFYQVIYYLHYIFVYFHLYFWNFVKKLNLNVCLTFNFCDRHSECAAVGR